MNDQPEMPTRRRVLNWLIALGSAITGMAMAVPGLMYLWPAARGGAAHNVEVEGAGQMTVGDNKVLQLAGKPIIVVRDRGGYVAYSAVCTHLGCLVRWDVGKQEFLCPCHAAVFDKNGHVVSGPPPGPLPEYKVTEAGGKVYVSQA